MHISASEGQAYLDSKDAKQATYEQRVKDSAYWIMHDCANPIKKKYKNSSYPRSYAEEIILNYLDANEDLAEVFQIVASNKDVQMIGELVSYIVKDRIHKIAEMMEDERE